MTHRKLAVISKYIRVGDENTHADNSIGQLDLTSTTSIEPYPLVSSSRSWSPALVVLVCGWTRSIYLKSTFITTAALALARLLSSSVQQQKAHQSGPSSASVSSVRLLVWSHSQLQMEMKGGRGGRQQLSWTVLRILQIARLFAQAFHLLLQPHPSWYYILSPTIQYPPSLCPRSEQSPWNLFNQKKEEATNEWFCALRMSSHHRFCRHSLWSEYLLLVVCPGATLLDSTRCQ